MRIDKTTLGMAVLGVVLAFAPTGAAGDKGPKPDGQKSPGAGQGPGKERNDPPGRGHGGPPGRGADKPGDGPPHGGPPGSLTGAPPGMPPGAPGLHGDARPGMDGKRLSDLIHKEKDGTLTPEEKAELEAMRAHGPRGRGARKARLEELEKKEGEGKLSDEEKAELDKIKKVQKRFEQLQKKHEDRKAKRDERRREAKKEALKRFPGYVKNPAARDEFKKHARRVARLERAKDVAEAEGRDDLVARIDQLIVKENARHQKWLDKHGAAEPKGTTP